MTTFYLSETPNYSFFHQYPDFKITAKDINAAKMQANKARNFSGSTLKLYSDYEMSDLISVKIKNGKWQTAGDYYYNYC